MVESARVTCPFWRYYGGKFRASPRYPSPQHATIIEPFAGAAGYSCLYPNRQVILVDKDPVIAGIWAYLISVTEKEFMEIPVFSARDETVDDLRCGQDAKNLIGFWLNNGVARPCKRPSAWTLSYEHNGWTEARKEKIRQNLSKIRHWKVRCADYRQIDNEEATWFIDPPYIGRNGRHYTENAIDYTDLAAFVTTRNGQVIACEQAGAEYLPWNFTLSVKSAPGAYRKGVSTELAYVRG